MTAPKRKSEGGTFGDTPSKKSKSSEPRAALAPSTGSSKGASSRPARSLLQNEEPAFPRGGGSILTPLERREIEIKAHKDAFFEEATGQRASSGPGSDSEERAIRKERRTGSATAEGKTRKLAGRSKGGERQERSKLGGHKTAGLSYRRLVPGSLVLGRVSQIGRYDVALSLPNNLTGYVPITAVSTKLTERLTALADESDSGDEGPGEGMADDKQINLEELFSVGQYLRAAVTSASSATSKHESRRHIELSLLPRQCNLGLDAPALVDNSTVQAEVVSIEDHGLVMDLGLDGQLISGFMSSKEVGCDLSTIREGAVLLCAVTGRSLNGKIVKLSADLAKYGNLKKGHYLADAPSIDAFLPGTAVELIVTEVDGAALAGKVMGMIDVSADIMHSGARAGGRPLSGRHSVKDKVKGRIIFTTPKDDERRVGISLLDHILSFRPAGDSAPERIAPPEHLFLSSIVEENEVVKVEPSVGLFVKFEATGKTHPGFVHISRIADGTTETLEGATGPFKIGSKHRGRIVGHNSLDGIFMLSFEKSILEAPFLRTEDVKVGEVVQGTVGKMVLGDGGVEGVVVQLTESISGFVPSAHMSDVPLQHPEKKFREGTAVKARVLSVNLERRRIRLTLKKSLINMEGPPWKSFDALAVGTKSTGTITNLLKAGAVVQFFGSVRGFLPAKEMSEAFIDDPRRHFRVGQSVQVSILSLDPAEKRMIVSCRDRSAFSPAQAEALRALKPGSRVSGQVTEKTADLIILELDESRLRASIAVRQLLDGKDQKCHSAAKRIRVGQTLRDLMVLSVDQGSRQARLTSRLTLIKAAERGELPGNLDALRPGTKVTGWVSSLTPTSVFVRLGGQLTGLLPKSHLAEDSAAPPDEHATVTATVANIDHDQSRFSLTQRPLPETPAGRPARPSGPGSPNEPKSVHDGTPTTVHDYAMGKITKAKVTAVKATQLNVDLADGVQGRIDASSVFDEWSLIPDKKQPLKKFSKGDVLDVRILGIHDSRNHRFLPITHTGRASVLELTAKKSDLAGDLDVLTLDKVEEGSRWTVFVNNVGSGHVWVNLSPNVRGRIDVRDLPESSADAHPAGSALQATVTSVDLETSRLDLSARPALTIDNIAAGTILPAKVTKVSERHVVVELSEHLSAPVNLVDMADDYSSADPTAYEKYQIIKVFVAAVDRPNRRVVLSTRPSRVLSSALPVRDREVSMSTLRVNDTVRGFVKNVADQGLFVTIGDHLTAYVRVSDLSDSYLTDWKSHFHVDQLVRGKVIATDEFLGHVQMSMKESVLAREFVPPLLLFDLEPGQVVTGKVRAVKEYGVFVVLDNSDNVSGLCHRSEMADGRVDDVKKLFEEGDKVIAKVLSIDHSARKLSLGLKPAYFEAEELSGDGAPDGRGDDSGGEKPEDADSGTDEQDDEDHQESKGVGVPPREVPAAVEEDSDSRRPGSTPNGRPEIERTNSGKDLQPRSMDSPSPGEGLQVGFDWTGETLDPVSSDSDTRTPEETKRKKKRKAEIKVDLTGELDAEGPQKVADFERLLLGRPHDSRLWIMYIAFHLQLDEVEQARAIAERAIRTIGHQTPDAAGEACNVWIAYLNLENTYGNGVGEVFKRACEYNDPEEMHSKLAGIYIQSGKDKAAEEVLSSMTRKFSNPHTWLGYGEFLFRQDAVRARALLPRALQSLPDREQPDLVARFATLEFKHGDPERGRTIFEELLTSFPKRLDLANILLELEMSRGHATEAFKRVTAMKLKKKQAQNLFKRWLQYEEKHGDAKAQDMVKATAEGWVKVSKGEGG